MSKRKAVRRITAADRVNISRLADILYDFLPLTAPSKDAVTFLTIFEGSSIGEYLDVRKNKKQALENGFTKVFRYHERLPRKLIRKVVPAAIEYRKYKRKPISRTELNELIECLLELGIDMQKELDEIKLDTSLPKITVPPEKLKEALRQYDLVTEIYSEPLDLFENGHFNESVRKAAEKFESVIQEKSGLDSFGRDLMARAFLKSDLLDLDKFQPINQDSFVEGYKFLAMGMTGAIRNVFSHGDEERRTPEECFEMLLFLNWMFRTLRD
ncbi:MAG: TIGR02391 family protein [Clostridia bacterium]|jgi:hypothetical protein